METGGLVIGEGKNWEEGIVPVNNNYEVVEYQGNASGRIFNFPFRCFTLEHLVVEHIDADGSQSVLVQNTDYAVTGGLDNSGGMITYPLAAEIPALTAAETLRIYRSTPMEQAIDYPTYQQAIENALDKSAMVLQEVAAGSAGAQAAIAGFELRVTGVETTAAGAADGAAEARTIAGAASSAAAAAVSTANSAVATAESADIKAEVALGTANTASSESAAALSTSTAANRKAEAAESTAATAAADAVNATATANSAFALATAADTQAETASVDAAAALTTANSMQTDVNAARVAAEEASAIAQTAIAAAADSTHGHANKAALDAIAYNSTTGSFAVGGVELARADLGNASGFADTTGSNISVSDFQIRLGLPEDTVDRLGTLDTQLGGATTAITELETALTTALPTLARSDATGIDSTAFKTVLAPRVVTTLYGVIGNYMGEQILRNSGVADDPENDMYFWDGSEWFKEGV